MIKISKIALTAPLAGSVLGGLTLGTIAARQKKDFEGKKFSKKERTLRALESGLSGALFGYGLGSYFKRGPRRKWDFDRRPPGQETRTKAGKQFQQGLKKHKTKAEAKKDYYTKARKYHPDKKGDQEAFKDINNQWDEFKSSGKFNKLAFLASIKEKAIKRELEKISNV
jgi:hypothetical protein